MSVLRPLRRLVLIVARRLSRPLVDRLRQRIVADLRADLERLHDPANYLRLPPELRDDLAALQPLLVQLRREVLAQVSEELRQQNEVYLAFHASFARQVADDILRIQKTLDTQSPARAA